MADFPYLTNPAKIKTFLGHIQSAGVPGKVTQKYLEQSGYKSVNDRALIPVLKKLDFLSEGGEPTENWRKYRQRDKAKSVLGAAIQKTYDGLFNTYPDAHRRDNEAIRNYFSAHTSVGEGALGYMVSTFKAVCELAEFDGVEIEDEREDETEDTIGETGRHGKRHKSFHGQLPAVNINIQLQIAATENADIYEKFFAAMKKHLLSND